MVLYLWSASERRRPQFLSGLRSNCGVTAVTGVTALFHAGLGVTGAAVTGVTDVTARAVYGLKKMGHLDPGGSEAHPNAGQASAALHCLDNFGRCLGLHDFGLFDGAHTNTSSSREFFRRLGRLRTQCGGSMLIGSKRLPLINCRGGHRQLRLRDVARVRARIALVNPMRGYRCCATA